MKFPIAKLNDYFKTSEPLKGIISVWGDFGVGKTTFALQTALNVVKSSKKVVYIYTKPNFPYEKIENMLQENSKNVLDNIIFVQSPDFSDLNIVVFNLEFLILQNLEEKNSHVGLIIIDSITDLYRLEFTREKKGKNLLLNYQLNRILANLSYLNLSYGIEVLIVNEISRRTQNGKTIEIQAGGKVIEYWISNAIKISRTEKLNERKFALIERPERKSSEILSILTEIGFK
jgi:RecA/RadA recombinase